MPLHNKVFGSSAIDSATWDDETQDLEIFFNGGRGAGSYTFTGFPENEWGRFIESHSAGSFFNVYIRGRYS